MMQKYNCVCCGREFEANKSNARFCSNNCCQKYNRRQRERTMTIDSLTDVIHKSFGDKTLDILANSCIDSIEYIEYNKKLEEILRHLWIPNHSGTGGRIKIKLGEKKYLNLILDMKITKK